MSSTDNMDPKTQRVITRFTRYLNGPLGKTVLNNLDEGESFILQTSEHSFKITKIANRAVVELLSLSRDEENWLITVDN